MQSDTWPDCNLASASVMIFESSMISGREKRQVVDLHVVDPDVARSHQVEPDSHRRYTFQWQILDLEDVLCPLVAEVHARGSAVWQTTHRHVTVFVMPVDLALHGQLQRRLFVGIGDAEPNEHRKASRGRRGQRPADEPRHRSGAGKMHRLLSTVSSAGVDLARSRRCARRPTSRESLWFCPPSFQSPDSRARRPAADCARPPHARPTG